MIGMKHMQSVQLLVTHGKKLTIQDGEQEDGFKIWDQRCNHRWKICVPTTLQLNWIRAMHTHTQVMWGLKNCGYTWKSV